MPFLPIVDRELRVASRNRITYWSRIAAAAVAILIGAGFFAVSLTAFGTSNSLGKYLFATLTWLAFAGALGAGLFLTSDCVSEEKREGTLGFLFLTDLRGHDIVLGKLLSTSLQSIYALIAILPVAGVTLLMGGVTGAQFGKTSLALMNALFISLAAGLFASVINRESQKAMTVTLLLLVLVAGAGPAVDSVYATLKTAAFKPALCLTSPVYLFMSTDAGRTGFYLSLLANQIIMSLLLSAAFVLLPRSWQESARRSSPDGWRQRWKFGSVKTRIARARKLLAVSPVLWLATRERWQGAPLWLMTGLAAALFVVFVSGDHSAFWFGWGYLSGPLTLVVYLYVASHAGRFFVDSRRAGFLELLLGTPVSPQQTTKDQWRALLRVSGVALTLFILIQGAGAAMSQYAAAVQMANIPRSPAGGQVTTATNTFSAGWVFAAAGAVSTILTIGANLAALCWFGMWMGLTSKNTNMATLKTMLFVQIIPWFSIAFASAVLVPALILTQRFGLGQNTMMWYPLVNTLLATVLSIAKDVGFVFWSRRKLHGELRLRAIGLTPTSQTPSTRDVRHIAS